MRKLSYLSVLALAISAPCVGRAADDLFSKVSVDAVFSSPSASSNGPAGSALPRAASRTIAGPASLNEALQSAGFTTKEVNSQVISTDIRRDKWSLPVLMTVAEDKQSLRIVMLLSSVADEKAISSNCLLTLMSLNRELTSTSFAYSSKRKRFELHRVVATENLSSERLREHLNELADIAEKSQESWDIAATAAKPNAAAAAAPSTSNAASDPAAIIGKWSATRSATDAFALQINADRTFALVTVSGGRSNQSVGNFTLNGQVLTLTGKDGTRVTGTVTVRSKDEFQLVLQSSTANAASLTFKRAS